MSDDPDHLTHVAPNNVRLARLLLIFGEEDVRKDVSRESDEPKETCAPVAHRHHNGQNAEQRNALQQKERTDAMLHALPDLSQLGQAKHPN